MADCSTLEDEGLWAGDRCCEVCSINGRAPAVCRQRITLKDGRSFLLCCKALEMVIRQELADAPPSG